MALLNGRERHHAKCAAFIQDLDRPLVTCEPVITECCFLLQRLKGAVDAVIANIERNVFQVPFRLEEAATSVRFLIQKYRDIPASLADASLIQMAEDLNTGDILTLDGDFRAYRWRRNRPFRLLLDEH